MGRRNAKGRFGVVVSRFNEFVTGRLLEGCLKTFASHGILRKNIDVIWVPGAFEIPSACQAMLRKRRYRALVTLGAVIRGQTPHFEYVALAASGGNLRVSLETKVPIGFGVVTTYTVRQAMDRSGKRDNRGAEAAESALQMAALFEDLRK